MSEWKEYKLGDVVTFGNGKVRPKEVGNTPVYGGNGILDFCNASNYSGETVIIGRVGAYCGSVYYENKPIWVSDNALSAKPKNGFNTQFLYYFLKNLRLNEFAEGSSHPLVTQTLLNSIDVIITEDIAEQKQIAEILNSLDDKIDLLGKQNATLEAMAETLFRQHFIENAKEEWKDGVIEEIAQQSKESIHPQKQPTNLFSLYSIPSFDNAKMPTLTFGSEIHSSKYKVARNCILFSKLNPHKDKRVWLLLDNVLDISICSTEFQIIVPIDKEYLLFIYGWLTYSESYNKISSGIGGTSGSHQRIDPATIFSLSCPIIEPTYVKSYNNLVKSLFEKQINNQKQICSLEKLRNILLAKLMKN